MPFINTRTELGERVTLDGLIDGSLETFKDYYSGSISTGGASSATNGGRFYNCRVHKLITPRIYYAESYAFRYNASAPTSYVTVIVATEYGTSPAATYFSCTYLTILDLDRSSSYFNIYANVITGCGRLKHLILRTASACGLQGTFLGDTPFASGGSGGSIYVPQSLISTYPTKTNWSTYNGYGTITWQPIESTYLRIDSETEEVDFVTLWKTSAKYTADQLVYYSDTVYRCLQAHTSADTTPDSDTENWYEEPSEDISTYKPLQYYYADGTPIYQSITKTLGAYGHSSNTDTIVSYDDPYETTITVDYGHVLNSVTVTMGGTDVTSTVYDSETGIISIAAVKGPITITVSAT